MEAGRMNEIGSLSPKSTIQFTEKGSSRCICVMGAKARGWQGIIFPFEYILRKGRFLGRGREKQDSSLVTWLPLTSTQFYWKLGREYVNWRLKLGWGDNPTLIRNVGGYVDLGS